MSLRGQGQETRSQTEQQTLAGMAYCWGSRAHGQLGNGSTTNNSAPVAVSGGLTFATVSTGDGQTCGVTPAGTAYCWGYNRAPRASTNRRVASRPRISRRTSTATVGVARDSRGRIRRSASAKRDFMRSSGFSRDRLGYVIDHVAPLACGDAP